MLTVLGTHAGDCDQAIRLMSWIAKLSPNLKHHDFLLVADPSTPFDKVCELKELADKIFGEVRLEVLAQEHKGWPQAANAMFYHAATWVSLNTSRPWLWLESDCVPMVSDWLERIELNYQAESRPFMGHIYETESWQPHLPKRVMSGVAVYPADAAVRLQLNTGDTRAWDMVNADLMVTNGAHTNLVRHRWGLKDLPPTFVESRNASTPINAFTVDQIHAECVLFHRNKDGSLIRLLDRKLFPDENRKQTFIQLGRYGDIILLLPAMLSIFKRTGKKPRMIVAEEYASVLDGVSYVEAVPLAVHWWNGMSDARAYADKHFEGGKVTQCYAIDWGIDLSKWPNFSTSMWDRTGVPLSEMQTAPMVFDLRSENVERKLVAKVAKTSKPLLLLSMSGHSSPFPYWQQIHSLAQQFADRFELVDIGGVQAPRIFDLLGLFDCAAGMITSDTATLWLAQASAMPYIAFSVDGWCGSIPRGNCQLNLKYSEVPGNVSAMIPILEQWASA